MYYVIGADGQQYGPIDEATLRGWLGDGRVSLMNLSFRTGEAQWIPLRERPEFADLTAGPPMPPNGEPTEHDNVGGAPRSATIPPPPPVPSSLPPDAIRPENAKDPIVILILALFLGGISYFVLGQWQKGLAGVAVWLCGLVLSILTCGIGAILMIPVVVLLVIDAYSQAKILKGGRPIGQWTFFSQAL